METIFISLVRTLVNNTASFYILLAVYVALLIANKVIKIRVLRTVTRLVNILVLLLIFYVAFLRYYPALSDYVNKYNATHKSSTPTKTTKPKSTPSTQSTPKQQTTPSQQPYQAPKRLYYSVGCSNCYGSGCPRSGYSYSGYDAQSWAYYKTLCQEGCRCADFKSYSLWR